MSKQKLRIALSVVAVVVVIALVLGGWLFQRQGGMATLFASAVPSAPEPNLQDPALIARGKYLALAGDCVACHTEGSGQKYAGGLEFATPFGTMYSTNITPDVKEGIGSWSANDFWRVIHYGVSPKHGFLYPAYPFTNFNSLSRQDSDAIFAYLKSLPPSSRPNTENKMPFPFSFRPILLGWRLLFFKAAAPYQPDAGQSAAWNRGKYLVDGLGHCNMCHSGRGPFASLPASMDLSGGEVVGQGWYGPALNQEGLADWSVDDIARLLRAGVSPKGAAYGPMADAVFHSLQFLTPEDAAAIGTYLKAVPTREAPEPTQFAVNEEQAKQLYAEGSSLYASHCAQCHQPQGQGHGTDYPPLAGNGSVTAEGDMNVVRVIMVGGVAPVTGDNKRPFGMPPFGQRLTDRQVAALATFVRNAWGNKASAVSPEEVQKLRGIPL